SRYTPGKARSSMTWIGNGTFGSRKTNLNFHWNLNGPQNESSSTCPAPAHGWPWPCCALSGHAVAIDWAALPAFAELLGICGRGHWPFRTLGGWLDGSRAYLAMPSVGNVRP